MNASSVESTPQAWWVACSEAARAGAAFEWSAVIDHGAPTTTSATSRWEYAVAWREVREPGRVETEGNARAAAGGVTVVSCWSDEPFFPSVRHLWAGARVHEEEATALFDAQWVDRHGSTVATSWMCRAFGATAGGTHSRSLRRDVWLVPRAVTNWPGSTGEPSARRRQRFQPPGRPPVGVTVQADGTVVGGADAD